MLVLGGLHRTIPDWSIDLDYCDIEWLVLETNRDHAVIFEMASKYCILDSFFDDDVPRSSPGGSREI